MAWTVISSFVLDQILGYQTMNYVQGNLVALASARHKYELGGSRVLSLPQVASAQDCPEWIDQEIDGTALGGFTVQARVEVRGGAGTAVTPKIRNMTTSTDAGTGASGSGTAADYSGANQKQTFAVTLAAGVNKYRAMGTPANTTDPTFIGHAQIELFATA